MAHAKKSFDSSKMTASPKVVRALSPYLSTFLHGTVQSSSPLSKLRGQEHILRLIWEVVCEEWLALHVDHFPVDLAVNRIPELLPWQGVRDDNNFGPQYPSDRQSCAGCPVVVIEENVLFPSVSSVPLDTFKNQESKDLYVNMMPFNLREESSLPPLCRQYWPMIEKCKRLMNFRTYFGDVHTTGYLTIDERPVHHGSSQRRPGLHVESPGVMPLIQTDMNLSEAVYRIAAASGTYVPGAEHHWGGGMLMRNETVDGGIFMASNIADTTAVWNCRINDEDGDFIGAHGDIERFRDLLGPCARTLEAGELIWMTDRTPHESLPIPASAGSKRRQYFRLVVGQVSAWFADHSTPNPLGTVPSSDVRIIQGNKFTLYPTPTRSWHCGTPEQMQYIRSFQHLQQRLYLFGLGHLCQRAFDYGLTSPSELIRIFKLQGGLPKHGDVDWKTRYSRDGKTELFDKTGAYYYDRPRFYEMVCSFTKLLNNHKYD